ncbi:MAG: hypothetical protein Q9169_007441 [Polycauliona sp. 2 TL-2023]
MVPITSRSRSFGSDSSSLPNTEPTTSSSIFRGRAKTLASLTTQSKSSEPITPAEIQLPRDPYINGQRIEVFLYKEIFECSICFIYYPKYGNKTRCCDQWICSECFVQIKRPDPHPPEHTDPSAPPPPPTTAEEAGQENELVSEPATCPFCKQSEFGVTYEAPPFRRGLSYVNQPSNQQLSRATSAMSSSSSLSSAPSGGQLSPNSIACRRTTSIAAADASVITTDKVRPDWYDKLMTARANAMRRSAAATALHTVAYMNGDYGFGEGRGLTNFGRRGILRRSSGPEFSTSGSASAHASMMALLSERHAAGTLDRLDRNEWNAMASSFGPGRGSSRMLRREEEEMEEAIRASIATEAERHRQEDKAAKKEAKRAGKEAKKKEKAARKAEKSGLYPSGANDSRSGLSTRSETSLDGGEPSPSVAGKGKKTFQSPGESSFSREPLLSHGRMPPRSETDVGTGTQPLAWDLQTNAQSHLERARAQLNPELSPSSLPYGSSNYKPSHLRTTSNVSSSASSINEPFPTIGRHAFHGSSSSLDRSPGASGENIGQASSSSEALVSGTPPGGVGSEQMINFRSLAAMIGREDNSNLMDVDAVPRDNNAENQPISNGAAGDRAVNEGRSESMATERPRTEFYDSAEYPHGDSGAARNEFDPTIEMKDDVKMVNDGDEGMHRSDGQAVT